MWRGARPKESDIDATAIACVELSAEASIVGVDSAKNVFQLAAAEGQWRPRGTRRAMRAQLERFFANRAVSLAAQARLDISVVQLRRESAPPALGARTRGIEGERTPSP
jgi:hypothetical protein